MVCLDYGRIFRQIRKQKHVPLSYFQKVGITKSVISKFERGETMMSFERVQAALQAIDVSLTEYELILNNFISDFQETFLDEIENAAIYQDFNKLNKLYEESKGTGNRFLVLSTKAQLQGLEEVEISELVDYLKKVDHWGYLELCLLYTILDYLNPTLLKEIVKEYLTINYTHNTVYKYRRKFYLICFSIILNLIGQDDREGVLEILNHIPPRPRIEAIDFYVSVFGILVSGLKKYLFSNTEDGYVEVSQALELIEILGNVKLRKYYENRINRFLGEDFLNQISVAQNRKGI
jgi:Rgg/GadR/MutR family transcriptional activator